MRGDMYEWFNDVKEYGILLLLAYLKLGDFVKIDELCQNEDLWSNNLHMVLYSWWYDEIRFDKCFMGV